LLTGDSERLAISVSIFPAPRLFSRMHHKGED
jgi:hypothetical protein